MRRASSPPILAAALLAGCPSDPDPERETVKRGMEVTFYPTYGYRSGEDWVIPLRAWVHENRSLPPAAVAELAERFAGCDVTEIPTFKERIEDFKDDSESGDDPVEIAFEGDPARRRYLLPERDLNGRALLDLVLPAAEAAALLEAQGSTSGWLSYRVVTEDYEGSGRARLIEPQGLSVVTDIDDTLKVTGVPGDKAAVVQATFCRGFVAAPGMAEMYRAFGDAPVHYVSGGPWQLYGPLYDFLVAGPAGFAEGSFHFNEFPKNALSPDTWGMIKGQVAAGSLSETFDHKVRTITALLERFPGRRFVLVGDSGELDPEVFKAIRAARPQQVQEIRIRDVLNERQVNPWRLEGVVVIDAGEALCATAHHAEGLASALAALGYPAYARNIAPPCGG